MHSEAAIASIDDTDMDNENENNLNGSNSNLHTASISASVLNHVNYNPDFEVNNSSIDLDTYITGFNGLMKINRLVFLAEHCPNIRVDALRLALTCIQETYNSQLYISCHKQLTDAYNRANQQQAQSQPLPPFDASWIENSNKKSALKLEKLDADLKSAKSLSIKDCIRRGQEDLADHFLDMGDLTNALKCYSRSRDYCSSNKHIVTLCLNVIKVSIYLKNWSYVLSYVNKVESAIDLNDNKEDALVLCKVKCAAGLAELNSKRYKSAANYFLTCNFDNFNFSEIITPNNIAVYGALCALATFDRRELQSQVIQSSGFKSFLELEPQIREILFKFNESKYAICLKLMDQIKDHLCLDLYLSPHVSMLYSLIRHRALRQYFSPYKSADMNKMALAFNTTTANLEEELINLILDGQIQARIDSQNKILYAKDVDQRSATFEKSIEMGKEYQKRTRAIILRTLVMKYNISVKPNQQHSNEAQIQLASR
jgi:COP9 signalosome complex subunit 1